MKTPKQYNDNLKCGILTEEMIGACIYSFNKRAKIIEIKEINIDKDIITIDTEILISLMKKANIFMA